MSKSCQKTTYFTELAKSKPQDFCNAIDAFIRMSGKMRKLFLSLESGANTVKFRRINIVSKKRQVGLLLDVYSPKMLTDSRV